MDLNLGDTKLLIDACQKAGLLRNQCAYLLATAYHETAHTMKPITEMGGHQYLSTRRYWPYIGRGYVQLTWDYNYKKASTYLGVDFMAHPELLLQAQYAAPIIVRGMVAGWFTGKKLSDYIDLQNSDFVNARRIINGTDQAHLIAGYAQMYDDMLKSAGYGTIATQEPVQSVPPSPVSTQPETLTTPIAPPVAQPEVSNSNIIGLIANFVIAILKGIWTKNAVH